MVAQALHTRVGRPGGPPYSLLPALRARGSLCSAPGQNQPRATSSISWISSSRSGPDQGMASLASPSSICVAS